jgi:hypothetical protein
MTPADLRACLLYRAAERLVAEAEEGSDFRDNFPGAFSVAMGGCSNSPRLHIDPDDDGSPSVGEG